MKRILGVYVIAILIALVPVAARANSVDAGIAVNQAINCGTGYACAPVDGLTFSFSSPSDVRNVSHFTNMSGVSWHSLILTEANVPAIAITCTSNLFSCQVVPYGANGARIVLTALAGKSGIAAGQSFELGVGCKGDCSAWPANLEFTAAANVATPEPNTLILFATGLGLVLLSQKKPLVRAVKRLRGGPPTGV